jgi:cytochrome c biogenesis protein CcmG, thiol:disulfide interchange protein DsbE
MFQVDDQAPAFSLTRLDGTVWSPESAAGRPTLLVFFETDCPTCRLTIPYLNRLARELAETEAGFLGISQDPMQPTIEFAEALPVSFPIALDRELEVSRLFDPVAVPTLFLIDGRGKIIETQIGFDKNALNSIAKKIELNREKDGRCRRRRADDCRRALRRRARIKARLLFASSRSGNRGRPCKDCQSLREEWQASFAHRPG